LRGRFDRGGRFSPDPQTSQRLVGLTPQEMARRSPREPPAAYCLPGARVVGQHFGRRLALAYRRSGFGQGWCSQPAAVAEAKVAAFARRWAAEHCFRHNYRRRPCLNSRIGRKPGSRSFPESELNHHIPETRRLHDVERRFAAAERRRAGHGWQYFIPRIAVASHVKDPGILAHKPVKPSLPLTTRKLPPCAASHLPGP
jgi:hypothetical protein